MINDDLPLEPSLQINTAKLPDAIAELFEKQHEICLLAIKYDIPMFGILSPDNSKNSFCSRHVAREDVKQEILDERVNKLIKVMDSFIREVSSNQLCVRRTETEDNYSK